MCSAPRGHPAYEGCGRPCKYSQADVEKFADELLLWLKDKGNVWFKDFCLDQDLDPDFMAEWAKENEKFAYAYKIANHRQESRLINLSFTGGASSAIAKFVLTNKHGYVDKQETKISGDSVNPLACILQNVDGKSKELVDETES